MRTISLSELFRPWAAVGVTAFIAEEPVNLCTEPGQLRSQRSSSAPPPLPRPVQPPPTPPVVGEITSGSTSLHRPSAYPVPPSTEKHQSILQHKPAPVGQPCAAWPAPFTELFSKLAPSPVLWTYAELGDDLSGKGSPERSAFLRTLIQKLTLPKGTSVFWPYALPGVESVNLGYTVFQEGIALLNPKVVIFVGASALCSLQGAIALSLPFTQQIHKGKMHILFPEFAELLANSSLLERSCLYLRATLTALGVYQSNNS